MVNLNAVHDKLLQEIEAGHGSTSEALLLCIRLAHEQLLGSRKKK